MGIGRCQVKYQRGDTLTFGFNLYTNFDDLKAVWRDESKQAVTGRPSEGNTDWQAVAQQLDSNAGYQQSTLYEQGDALVIAGEQLNTVIEKKRKIAPPRFSHNAPTTSLPIRLLKRAMA
ncbi:YjbH domain-containing protein [Vibrio vulnificus]|uniref:YjbH domain-containing protein n=1 Tax=Vibrio vulnificus TaxID=672 RepID=UPI00107C7A5A|nr:YjbH domain-containing protein [Vibrio vulnificus]QBH28403.1 Putative outer membrane lipoprotein YmcA [Vibrio vulnificus]